ncbi:MAG: tripartite tricarboxylate transporter permease, partial [Candidatus Izemoplasmatales bacterium]
MIIIFCFLGIIAGIIAGLTPGLHANNIAIIALTSPFFGEDFAAFILSMCIVQTFVDFVPTIFLGAPDTETFEGVLPGHAMLLEGKGMEAICLTVFGGIIAI